MALRWKSGAPRRVFISGGGSGIGREFAKRLAAEGADVAIFNRKLAPEVIAELRALGRRANQRFESYSADVSDALAIRSAIEWKSSISSWWAVARVDASARRGFPRIRPSRWPCAKPGRTVAASSVTAQPWARSRWRRARAATTGASNPRPNRA